MIGQRLNAAITALCHEEVLIALEKMPAWTARETLALVDSQVFDLVLVNEYLPDAECEDLLKAMQKKGAQIPCIVMQPSAPAITDLAALQALGAHHVVCKHAYRQIVEIVGECLACDNKTPLVVGTY